MLDFHRKHYDPENYLDDLTWYRWIKENIEPSLVWEEYDLWWEEFGEVKQYERKWVKDN